MGAYIIKRVLGYGGFGITYLAYDTRLEIDVAVKEFFPSQLCGREQDTNHLTDASQANGVQIDQLKKKFVKEAKNIAKLNHPNIIRILTAFEENNTAYYVMDYIEGHTLLDIVKGGGPLSPERARGYIDKVGSALEYLHANHMTHLDVKPANIMIRAADDNPILIDFGLSKNFTASGDATSMHGPVGISPGFSPIEQYNLTNQSSVSHKSDLYALAATYYYLLTGNVPPEAVDLYEGTLQFPASVPPNEKSAIAKAMHITAGGRHESVREFLEHVDKGEPDEEEEAIEVIAIPDPSDTPEAVSADHYRPTPAPAPEPTPGPTPTPTPAPRPYPPRPIKPRKSKKMLIMWIAISVGVAITVRFIVYIYYAIEQEERRARLEQQLREQVTVDDFEYPEVSDMDESQASEQLAQIAEEANNECPMKTDGGMILSSVIYNSSTRTLKYIFKCDENLVSISQLKAAGDDVALSTINELKADYNSQALLDLIKKAYGEVAFTYIGDTTGKTFGFTYDPYNDTYTVQ